MNKTVIDLSNGEAKQVPMSAEELNELEEAQAKDRDQTKTEYQRQRATAYPPITDYIDGVVKGDTAQVQAYIDECLAIKAKYPKPV